MPSRYWLNRTRLKGVIKQQRLRISKERISSARFYRQLDACHCASELPLQEGARAPLASHLQSQPWSPAAASGPCGEGLAGGHRQPPSGPRGSVGAGAECSHTSGICLGCRRVAGERERAAGSSMFKWTQVSERLGAKLGHHVLYNGSQGRLERDRETSGRLAQWRGLLGRLRGLSSWV